MIGQDVGRPVREPAYGLLLLAGGIGIYTPALRRQIAALDTGGPDTPRRSLAARGQAAGIGLAVIVVVIVFLMVVKPGA